MPEIIKQKTYRKKDLLTNRYFTYKQINEEELKDLNKFKLYINNYSIEIYIDHILCYISRIEEESYGEKFDDIFRIKFLLNVLHCKFNYDTKEMMDNMRYSLNISYHFIISRLSNMCYAINDKDDKDYIDYDSYEGKKKFIKKYEKKIDCLRSVNYQWNNRKDIIFLRKRIK